MADDVQPKVAVTDTHFTLEEREGELYFCRCTGVWDPADVDRLKDAVQPRIEASSGPRFVMDLTSMEDISLSARWHTSSWMKTNRGKVVATAVILAQPAQRIILSTLARASGRKNLRAFSTVPDAVRWVLDYVQG